MKLVESRTTLILTYCALTVLLVITLVQVRFMERGRES